MTHQVWARHLIIALEHYVLLRLLYLFIVFVFVYHFSCLLPSLACFKLCEGRDLVYPIQYSGHIPSAWAGNRHMVGIE